MADNQVILNADIVFDQTKIQQRFAQLERNLKFRNPFDSLAGSTRTFYGELDRATTRVVTLGTAFTVLATASRTLRRIVESTVLVEKSLSSVNAIFKLTTENLSKFSSGLFDISRETVTAFDKVAEAAQEFARQGLSVAETQKAVRAALLLSRDATLSVSESVRAITAATNSFNKEALSRMQIVNRLASADAAFAVSSKDLAEALVRTGSAAADAGVSFNEFIGLVTAAQQISQRGGSVIAGALNTIFTRINRRGTLEALDSLGVAITDVRGQALPTIDVLRNLATAYDKMTGSVKNQTAELVGGVRQLNTLKATLQDLSSQSSVFAQVQEVIKRNTNEIERRNAARNQTLAAQGSQLGTTAQQIGSNIGNVGVGPALKSGLGFFLNNPITQALKEADGQAETAGGKAAEAFLRGFGSSVVYGLGPILLKILGSITRQVGGNLLQDVAAITGLNSVEKQRLAIETDIVAVYKAGGTALQQQLSQMTSLAEKAALVRGLMSGTGTMVTPVSAIATQLQSEGYKRTRRVPGMAGGYIPFAEEMAAVNAGVGGAKAGSRPVLLNNFNFGGGKVGQIVANTSEYLVPHFAGGSAIFNQEMIQKMGLPPGAKPIAAGGYVPHAAEGMGYGPPPHYGPDYNWYGGSPGLAGRTPPPPPPLPLPSSALSSGQLAKDFEMAQKEIVRNAKEQARKAKEHSVAMDEAFKILKAENQMSRKKSGFTKAEMALQERRLAEYQAAADEARRAATKAFADEKDAAAAAKAATAPPPRFFRLGPNGEELALIPGGLGETETDAQSVLRVKNLQDSQRLGRSVRPDISRTYPERFFKRDFQNLRIEDLENASGLNRGPGVDPTASDRYVAGQVARGAAIGNVVGRQGVNYAQLGDALRASRGLAGGQTLDEQFDRTVKELLSSGRGMQTAYRVAIDQLMNETDNRKQINSIIRKGIPTHVAYQREMADALRMRGLEKQQIQGEIGRQTVFNSANARLGAGDQFNALTPAQKSSIVNNLRSQAIQKLGFSGMGDTAAILSNPTARAQINAEIAPMLAALKRPSTGEMHGPPLPPGWNPDGTRPSFWSRANAAANRPGASIGLSLAAPFLGGIIGEGKGGTTAGQVQTAASYGLQGMGMGAAVGSLIPGVGTLGGAAIGTAIGALSGAIMKASKSFEEMSLELDQNTKRLQTEFSTAAEFFRVQSDLRDAIRADNQEQVIALKKQSAQLRTGVRNTGYLDIMNRFGGNPEAGSVALAKYGNQNVLGPDALRSSLLQAIGEAEPNLSSGFKTVFTQDPSSMRGDRGDFPRVKQARIPIEEDLSEKLRDPIIKSVMAAMASLTPEERKTFGEVAQSSITGAAAGVGQLAGFDGSQIADLVGKTSKKPQFAAMMRYVIQQAVKDLGMQEKEPTKALEDVIRRETDLSELASRYRARASAAGISGGANLQIAQIRNQIALSSPALTDIGRLQLQGTQGTSAIASQFGVQRETLLGESKAKMLDLIQQAAGSPVFDKRVEGLSDAASVQALIRDMSSQATRNPLGLNNDKLGVPGSDFRKSLDDLLRALNDNTLGEKENTRSNNEGNRLMLEELRFTKTAAGAQREVSGAFFNTRQDLESAIRRRDPLETIEAARAAARAADLNAMRFNGLLNDQQYGAGMLGLQSDQSYGQRSRTLGYAQGRGAGARIRDINRDSDLSFAERQMALQDAQGRGARTRVGDMMRDQSLSLEERIMLNRDQTTAAWRSFAPEETVRQGNIEGFNLNAQRRVSLGLGYSEGKSRLDMARYAARQTRQGRFTSGSEIAGRDFAVAQEQGLQGDSIGSLQGGFTSVFAGLKRDVQDFAVIGKAVADSLNQSLGNAFGDFVTGAKQGKDAFRSFAVSVLGDTSRMLASKSLSSLLSFIPGFSGFGSTSGGVLGFAGGGMVPAMLTGGEYVVGPNAARRIGYDTLRRMNGMAEGGMVNGGSGVKDDVPARLAPGSFVLKKSATQRIGPDYMNALVAGRVQHRAIGGLLASLFGSTLSGAATGAVLGGGLGYLAGGKKGAIGGALLGGIGGGLYGGQYIGGEASAISSAGGATLSVGQKVGLGLGAAAGLGLLAAGVGQTKEGPGALNDSQLPAYRQQLEAAQATAFGARPNPYPILQVGPQGQNYIAGFTDGPATRRWGNGGSVDVGYAMPAMRSFAEGGDVDVPLTVGSSQAKSGGDAAVSVKIDIHNNGTTTSTSSSQGGQGEAFQGDFANKLQKTVQGLVQQELVNQSRSDGFFSQRGRYLP